MIPSRLPQLLSLTALPAVLLGLVLLGCSDDTMSSGPGGDGVAGSSGGSTDPNAGVLCDYDVSVFNDSASVNAMSTSKWTCSQTTRTLTANGLPDHAVGTFPNPDCPNTIAARAVTASFPLTPVMTDTATQLGGPAGEIAYLLNGVKIDAGTNGGCNDSGDSCSLADKVGQWSIEALGQTGFNFGTDANNAHVQPGGAYHYHGMPEGFVAARGKGQAMTLVGWAADGFPVYARYGYTTADDASSAIKVINASYRLKAEPDANRPPTSLYAMGTFTQDYEYAAGSGDLDECNGRTGVTPEFPEGTYHYFATDTYPYLQRCVKGQVTASTGGPGTGTGAAGMGATCAAGQTSMCCGDGVCDGPETHEMCPADCP
jgi:hypothetical protein